MLADLAPELLSYIALNLVLETSKPPVDLLCTCRAIYAACSPETNPNLYAEVFRYHYDIAAPKRRLGNVTSTDYVAELRTRARALHRLGQWQVEEEDLWVVYLMLVENDTKNIHHLTEPLAPGPGVDILPVLEAYQDRRLAPVKEYAYPPNEKEDALAMWIAWLLDDYNHHIRSLRVLRPYVFAAHRYDLFFAPWTLKQLPLGPTAQSPPLRRDSFAFNPIPRSWTTRRELYGKVIDLAPPLLTHAAMLMFFGSATEGDDAPSSASAGMIQPEDIAADLRSLPRPPATSAAHDADFVRLMACTDGNSSAGRPLRAWKGVFDGCWEGTFTFLDFGAVRSMLAGSLKEICTQPYGEQAQVWKLRETFVRPRERTVRKGMPLRGTMTNAGFPKDMRAFAEDPIKNRMPGTSPEDATIDDAFDRQLEALEGYEVVPPNEVDAELAASEKEDTGLGLIVTGVGHSAWGRFTISGHVRTWDGMLVLVKEYAPDQRGKWVYRGYVVSNDLMVGRWRDTVSSEDLVGYEGTFLLSRRS